MYLFGLLGRLKTGGGETRVEPTEKRGVAGQNSATMYRITSRKEGKRGREREEGGKEGVENEDKREYSSEWYSFVMRLGRGIMEKGTDLPVNRFVKLDTDLQTTYTWTLTRR